MSSHVTAQRAAAESGSPDIESLYATLLNFYGYQGWWPGESAFEIAVGAILVQRTAWRNAELAIEELRRNDMLEPERLSGISGPLLQRLIRPAGFHAAKAAYLHALARFVRGKGGFERMAAEGATETLRIGLLNVHGIGPETADAILLYALGRPVWVVDAYATRFLSRLFADSWDAARQRAWFEPWVVRARTADLQEFHALIVAHGKAFCGSRPDCMICPLRSCCRYAIALHGTQ